MYLLHAIINYLGIIKALIYNHKLKWKSSTKISLDARICNGGRIELGERSEVRPFAVLSPSGGEIQLGENSCFGMFNYIDGSGGVYIGKNVRCGQFVCIYTSNHVYDDPERPICSQGLKSKKVQIEDDVWIGAHAVILAGTKIHHGSIIAAGAVVTHEVPENSIVAGIPARIIKKR